MKRQLKIKLIGISHHCCWQLPTAQCPTPRAFQPTHLQTASAVALVLRRCPHATAAAWQNNQQGIPPPCGQRLLETPLRGLGLNGIRIVSKKKQSCQHNGCSAPQRNLKTSGREHFAANVWNWFILIVPKCSNAQVCTSDDRLEYLEIASHR